MIKTELYVHIPFCVRKCAYCDFLSAPADEETRARYLAGLFDELKMWGDRCRGHLSSGTPGFSGTEPRQISSIFVGGGTPTTLSADQLTGLFERLHTCFDIDKNAEITVECNPGTLDDEKLFAMKNAGVNRLSIGLQSALDDELRLLGRIHTFSEFEKEYDAARKAGFGNINIDLMQALPGQDPEKAMYTVKRAAELEPEHISAYSLIVEEGTPFFEKYGSHPELLPDDDTDRRIYHETADFLEMAGFVHYEISNYAKQGYECRHNTGYWTGVEYIGAGLGAASYLGGQRFSNTRDISRYLRAGEHVDRKTIEILTEKEKMAEFMFLGLRMINGVSKREFEKRFGVTMDSVYADVLKKYSASGLLDTGNENVRLTEKGLDVCNAVMCEFL